MCSIFLRTLIEDSHNENINCVLWHKSKFIIEKTCLSGSVLHHYESQRKKQKNSLSWKQLVLPLYMGRNGNATDHWISRFYQETSDVLTGRSRSNKRQSEPKQNPSSWTLIWAQLYKVGLEIIEEVKHSALGTSKNNHFTIN